MRCYTPAITTALNLPSDAKETQALTSHDVCVLLELLSHRGIVRVPTVLALAQRRAIGDEVKGPYHVDNNVWL